MGVRATAEVERAPPARQEADTATRTTTPARAGPSPMAAGSDTAARAPDYFAARLGSPTRGADTPPSDPPDVLMRSHLAQLEDEALPAFQAALDALDEPAVNAAGRRALVFWHAIESEREALSPARSESPQPGAASLPAELGLSYNRVRSDLIAQIGTRRYRGATVAGAVAAPTTVDDVGLLVWEQTPASAWVAKDAAALLALLGPEEIPEAKQWTAVGLMRQHQNPTHFAFMLAVLERGDRSARLDRFLPGPHAAVQMLRAAQPLIRESTAADPLAEPGAFQLMLMDGRIRLLVPSTPEEIATEFYGSPERWTDTLRPYNRALLESGNGGGWLPAGTELLVDLTALQPRYRGLFVAAQHARSEREASGSEPYLVLRPEPPLVVGNTISVGVTWPNSLFGPQRLEWWFENDPIAVRDQGVPPRVDAGEGLLEMAPTGRHTSIEGVARAPGNHTVHCRLTNAEGRVREITRVITVMTLAERTEVASRYDTGASRRPQDLLQELRAERERLGDRQTEQRAQLDRRIAEVESAIAEADTEARRYRGPGSAANFAPIRAIYVSSEGAAMTVPLQIFVDRDPGYFDATDVHLKLWDFTLSGNIRSYPAAGSTYEAALRELLRGFADDAPYPTGNIRFFDVDFSPVGPYARPRETVTFPTDGGTKLTQALRAISMASLAVGVGAAALLQPEVALPAFVISGVAAGLAGTAEIYDRLEHGDFAWDLQTGMDLLDIAAGLLTVGIASGALTTVRGVGRLTVTGTLQLRIGQAQLAVMAGTHLAQISAAVESGDQDRVAQAVLRAVGDGALILIVHRAGQRLQAMEPRPAAEPTSGQTAQTMSGSGGPAPPGTPRQASIPEQPPTPHEEWVADRLRSGMGVRPPPLPQPGAAPAPEGTVRRGLGSIDEAQRVYDEMRARAPGREVAIYRNRRDGSYAVTVGGEGRVSSPAGEFGEWAGVQHYHPNEGNVLTYRSPAPRDLNTASVTAFQENRPHTEFIEHTLPNGGRTYTAYTVTPDGRVTIEYQRPDGSRYSRSFASIADYQADWGSRTRLVNPDPNNPEYRDLLRDIEDFYAGRQRGGYTASGTVRQPEQPVSGREAERAARAESVAWWRQPGVTTETRFARHEQTFRSIAATLRNLATPRGGRPARLQAPNEQVLSMPVDEFIRRNRRLALELAEIERDSGGNQQLRTELTEFLEGRLEAGAREVGSRRPDLVEFFLDRGEVVVTDYTVNTSRVHQLKTAFYREVMAALLGPHGPRVDSLDINLRTGEADVRP